jgi:N-acetylglutamate synthase
VTLDLHRLDRISRLVWPALRSIDVDGWEVRLSEGYTGRANSTTTLDEGGALPLASRIAAVEQAYDEALRPPWFRIPDFTDKSIDAALDARGYGRPFRAARVLTSADPVRDTEAALRIASTPEPAWLDTHAVADAVAADQRAAHDALFHRMPAPRLFAAALDGPQMVAVAAAALHGDVAFVHGVGTHPAARRRGHAGRVLRGLFDAAYREGARFFALQVGADNEAASPIYASLGFDEAYRYAYRRRDS